MRPDFHAAGMDVRRAVLGDRYVDRSLADADALSEPLQQLITEYCWGSVWAREGLPRPTRSLLNVVMLTALNRPNELRLHVYGALRNGCTAEEISEAILQAAVYCGVPAALDSMRVLRDVVAQHEGNGADGA